MTPLAALITWLMLTGPSLVDETSLDLTTIEERLEPEIRKELEKGVASISIALIKDGQIVWKNAYGHMNVAMKVPATPETIYVVGSTFKAVTATALLQLAEKDACHLDDPINDYLEDCEVQDLPESPVTIRHLLCHGSGLTRGENTVTLWSRTLPESLEAFTAKLESVRPPMEKYEYNNYAYGTAGLLVERISGQSYEDFVVEHILKPLGIQTDGPVHPTPKMVERLALPYVPGSNGKPRPVPQTQFDVYPAGDIYLTASDMARFLAAHLEQGMFNGQRLLNAESIEEAHRIHIGSYGLGWSVQKNGRVIQHGGGVSGFRTHMIGDLDARVGAYIASNAGNMAPLGELAIRLLRGDGKD